ncbi:large conductance mechanosensitive channel protein MscL [Pseudochelatococcus contaminans]|uniref:Large-conductance mechanosensitive channel n=1 Tax=Pseudochelatococcus contaminans TaxID=1538103 RepID=A0A7W5Z1F3_9HYPH|nr:large conductance mechanosensitive channel protein MscL [Pseudochelatococcus contaminans]MBB3808271.1 large conductance mechanosensitive channel [Pseudochelatococcus contaminans]
MLKEFREFALKGNVVDLAIGVIIGAAFSRIVESIVGDVFMPLIAAITRGGVDFSNYFLPLSGDVTATSLDAARSQGAVLAYGSFITQAINFLIVAWVLFLVVKAINELKRQAERNAPPPPAPQDPADVKLLQEIRDLLAQQRGPSA